MQFGAAEGRAQGQPHRPRAAAQVDDDRADWADPADPVCGERRDGLVDEEFGAAARHEDAGLHGDAQAAELGPAQDVFEGQPVGPSPHHVSEFVGRTGGGYEEFRLVLGEDAPGGAERGDDGGGKRR